jgi:carnitine-CoA ligase
MNTQYKGPMLRYAANYAEARIGVVDGTYLKVIAEVAGDLEHLERLVVVNPPRTIPDLPFEVVEAEAFLADAKPADDLPGPEYHQTACMIFTSGTTGPSKGVLMPWAELYEFPAFQDPTTTLAPGQGLYQVLPAFHAAGKVGLYMGALASARTVCREVFSITEFWSDVTRYDCHAAGVVGPLAEILLQMPVHPDEAGNPLERVMMGPLIGQVDEFRRRFGVEVITGYGMTEIGVPLASPGYHLANATSCGRVREGYELRVCNEFDEPLGPGEVGELLVRHRYPWRLNSGYWRMPEKTAEAWRNGWFHTGDAFRYDEDGNFYFVDRIKDAMRRRGENISSFEVELHVAEHPEVLECAAFPVRSELGEDDVAVVVSADELDPRELIEWLIPRMPRFMIPRYVKVTTDELPRTATMRVQKFVLADGFPDDDTFDREAAGIVLPKEGA